MARSAPLQPLKVMSGALSVRESERLSWSAGLIVSLARRNYEVEFTQRAVSPRLCKSTLSGMGAGEGTLPLHQYRSEASSDFATCSAQTALPTLCELLRVKFSVAFRRMPSQTREVLNNHPLAGHRRNSGNRRAILAVQVAQVRIRSAFQSIPACELEHLIGLEHPNSLAGRRIKSEEVRSRTVAVSSDSFPATVKLRYRAVDCPAHGPIILTGCEEHATSRE